MLRLSECCLNEYINNIARGFEQGSFALVLERVLAIGAGLSGDRPRCLRLQKLEIERACADALEANINFPTEVFLIEGEDFFRLLSA